jgi:ribonuclease P protein component
VSQNTSKSPAASPSPEIGVAPSREIGVAASPDTGAPPMRLKRRADFLRVAGKGRKVATHGLVLQALTRDDNQPARIGFTVTKKLGGAVVRNRARRRLKEAARLELADLELAGQQPGGPKLANKPLGSVDLVLIGRAATARRKFSALRDDLRRALRKAGVITRSKDA